MHINNSFLGRLFDTFNYIFLTIVALVTVIPFLHIVVGSVTPSEDLLLNSFILIPTRIDFDIYKYIFSTNYITRALSVSAFVTITGTLFQLAMTVLMAYPLAHKELMGRKYIMAAVVFTMLFNGGMIPSFFVVKGLGLLNSYLALIIPPAISSFNLIIIKNFFQSIPIELEESAKLDGANDLKVLTRIILPLSLPAIATFTLFYSVGHWNSFFQPLLYIDDAKKWPIQILLRQIVLLSQGGIGESNQMDENFILPAETVKMATIVVAALPIMLVYPFLQKHFAKGVLLGSVKG